MISTLSMTLFLLLTIAEILNDALAEKTICEFRGWNIAEDTLFYYQRIELSSAVDCAERCIENGNYCRAAAFLIFNTENKKFCQFYNANSADGNVIRTKASSTITQRKNNKDINLAFESILFEILDECPQDANGSDIVVNKLTQASKRTLRLMAPDSGKLEKIEDKILDEGIGGVERWDTESHNKQRTLDPQLLSHLRDEITYDKNINSKLSNAYITSPESEQKNLRIGIGNALSPIKPISVSRGYAGTQSSSYATNCKNGLCKPSGNPSPIQQNLYAGAYGTSRPCSARHSTDPCSPKQTQTPLWSEWTLDTACSVTCGKGVRRHRRFCSAGTGCPGESTKEEVCVLDKCNVWGLWSEWSRCTVTCGDNGQMMRERRCKNGNECEGPSVDVRACGDNTCPTWGTWGAWSNECSAKCGPGFRTRKRECSQNGEVCNGESIERQPCESRSCPSWEEWGSWSECTKSCAAGETTRRRQCLNGKRDECIGPSVERKNCNTHNCPEWAEWTLWSACSKTCGDDGSRLRARECQYQGYPSTSCPGPAQDQTACHLEPCSYWSEWSEWSSCSATCGHGQQKRTRECEPHGVGCKDGNQEIRFCQLAVCPYFDQWSEWGGCSVTCGREPVPQLGSRSKNETGRPRSDTDLLEPLGLSNYPASAEGSNDRSKSRSKETASTNGKLNGMAVKDGSSEHGKHEKNVTRPRIRGQLLQVAQSSAIELKKRSIPLRDIPEYFADSPLICDGPEMERKECDAGPCCNWTPWTSWGSCYANCGMGTRSRNRRCIVEPDYSNSILSDNENNFNYRLGTNYPIIPQNSGIARPKRQFLPPYNGVPNSNLYSNSAFRNSYPTSAPNFVSPSPISGVCNCVGRSVELEECNSDLPSEPCRSPNAPFNNARNSIKVTKTGHLSLSDAASLSNRPYFDEQQLNCYWAEWAEWNVCTGSCSKAVRSRHRECFHNDESCECNGENHETETCKPSQCHQALSAGSKPKLSLLPPHEADNVELEGNNKEETRQHNELESLANNTESSGCYWSEWSNWSNCELETKVKKRMRLCAGLKVINDCDCIGVATEEIACLYGDYYTGKVQQVEKLSFSAKKNNSVVFQANSKDLPLTVDWISSSELRTEDSRRHRDDTNQNTQLEPTSLSNCKWNEWSEWSECISTSDDDDCGAEGERTRLRECPCHSCEDGITQESESCIIESCKH